MKRGRWGKLGVVAVATSVGMFACSSPSTGVEFSVASLLRTSSLTTVVVRVHDAETGSLAFCSSYPVDESRAPGETISLVAYESRLSLAPASSDARTKRVRIVADAYSDSAEGACEGAPKSKPRIRKVAILPYAEGAIVPVRSLFDASCIDVLTCDEASSTCKSGACVSANVSVTSGTVESPVCFDIRSCPSLERATPDAACRFTLPASTSRGYAAATFRFDGPTESDTLLGAAVLSPGEYAVRGGTLELTGRMCELYERGSVDEVYFGYECEAPRDGAQICALPSASIPIDGLANGPGGPDGSVRTDATSDVGTDDARADATNDVGADAAADSTVDASTDADADATTDAPSDADGAMDSSTDADANDGSEGGGSGDSGGTRSVLCGSTQCSATQDCCITSGVPACIPVGEPCEERYTCDDATDCGGASCCITGGSSVMTTCRTACTREERELCSTSDSACSDPRTSCSPNFYRPGPPAAFVCAVDSQIYCGTPYCTLQEGCCSSPLYCGSPCINLLLCDDSTDCPGGTICCFDGARNTSTCTDESACQFSGAEILCAFGSRQCAPGTCERRARPSFAWDSCSF